MNKIKKGFSLVELLVVISLVGFLVILIASLPGSINLITKSRHLSLAREIVSREIEDKRSIQYINLATGESQIIDSRLNLLISSSGTSLVEDCDPSICTQGENIKKLTVTVSWKDNGKIQQIKMSTLISEGGLNK